MRNIFSTSFEDVKIIEATKLDMDKYGHMYGSSNLVITLEMFKELLGGKAIAMNDGEYSTFIMLDDELMGYKDEH